MKSRQQNNGATEFRQYSSRCQRTFCVAAPKLQAVVRASEFVDNAIQSSIDRNKELKALDGKDYRLEVDIRFARQEHRIIIHDNAGGIAASDYQRAFRPAEIPPDASGLSEFGMGMKSAACWFAPNWTVRTTALGENIERTIIFDIEKIVEDSTEELHVVSTQISSDQHYTEICLDNIRHFPRGRTVGKIRTTCPASIASSSATAPCF